jgi:hypothetical protein
MFVIRERLYDHHIYFMLSIPFEQNLRNINLTENVFFLGDVQRLHMVHNKQMKVIDPYSKLRIVCDSILSCPVFRFPVFKVFSLSLFLSLSLSLSACRMS